MKRYAYYEFRFEDGYTTICRGMNRNELAHEQLRHGKLVSQTYYGDC